MSVSFDVANGAIMEGDIRYVMMRPDVVMGIALELGEREAEGFLAAMERSAFRNSQTSFARHLESGRLKAGSLLAQVGDVAALLGWGVWTAEIGADGVTVVEVRNSPFAAGYGLSPHPVCAAISGVLKAIAYMDGVAVHVREAACAAQGRDCCDFHVVPLRGVE